MAEPKPRQSAGNAVGSGQSRTCTVTFSVPTADKNLVVAWAVTTSGTAVLTGPSGFTQVPGGNRAVGSLKLVMWYYEGAPAMTSVAVTTNTDRALRVQAIEYDGAAQSGALDKVTVLTGIDQAPKTGSSGTTAQADSIVVAAVANRYASATQFGFAGGLTRLLDAVTPSSWGFFGSDPDDRRCRLTVHQAITSAARHSR